MRIEDAFRIGDLATAREIVRSHPFATIVSPGLQLTRMPCLVDENADGLAILGHVARADPLAQLLDQPLLFVFTGPHGYVSGSWYGTDTIPTTPAVADAWHAEAKLSQDKPGEERARVLAGLEAPGPYAHPELAAAMRRCGA